MIALAKNNLDLVKVGTVLSIDGKPDNTATVDTVEGSWGVYILTSDNCRIPFSFEELISRKAEIAQ